MSRKTRIAQERAILAHHAHLPLLRGMAEGIEKVLPEELRFIIVTFPEKGGVTGGFVSNGTPRAAASALKHTARRMTC